MDASCATAEKPLMNAAARRFPSWGTGASRTGIFPVLVMESMSTVPQYCPKDKPYSLRVSASAKDKLLSSALLENVFVGIFHLRIPLDAV